MPPPFDNRYKKSHVKTDKDCWTCRKTTKTCLLTDNYASGGDFLYTCDRHLQDRNFATPLQTDTDAAAPPTSPSATTLSQSDIDAAVKEYEERKKAKSASSPSGDKEKDTKKAEQSKPPETKDRPKASQPSSPPPPPPEPTHYQLHKSFFDMRLRLQQQKQHHKEAQTRRSQLAFPSAPSARPGEKPAS
ncbi:hypothetical protein P389DRAFT_51242 [Cystobasidium minutum MCA 4210]|uniref:uncharacterized protein n=1 Tax=Cystobasidium minutum MCA 4210 TaxID=1397322 RepID=UPI0034CEFDBC|eukprot:jgi/Rhomi1/51242/CE51241_490